MVPFCIMLFNSNEQLPLGKVGFISVFKNRCLYVLMNDLWISSNLISVDNCHLFSPWSGTFYLLYLLNAYLQRYGYRLVRGFLLPPLATFLKMFPSNLCSARNETEPRLCRNLIMSSRGGLHRQPAGESNLYLLLSDCGSSTPLSWCIWNQDGRTKDVLRI